MLDKPTISIIVPLQEHLCFDVFLEAIARQECIAFADFEVVAVDSLYTRDWPPVVAGIRQRFPELQLSFEQIEPTRSRARQLNVAIGKARADLILMLADDFIPCPRLVSLHCELHRTDSSETLVGIGPGLFPDDGRANDFMHWLEDSGELFGVRFTDPELELPHYYFYMANTSIKRSLLQKAGCFDEDFPYDAMDDWEMGLRLLALGMRNTYVPDAWAIHEHILDLNERCRAMRQAGESAAIYDAKSDKPGPWGGMLKATKIPYSQRKRENRAQRYRRILAGHWLEGYRSIKQVS